MTDAEAETMLAECRAVLPALTWRLDGVRLVGSAWGFPCFESMQLAGSIPPAWRATAYVGGTIVTRGAASLYAALAAAREAALTVVQDRQTAVDRERAWLGVRHG